MSAGIEGTNPWTRARTRREGASASISRRSASFFPQTTRSSIGRSRAPSDRTTAGSGPIPRPPASASTARRAGSMPRARRAASRPGALPKIGSTGMPVTFTRLRGIPRRASSVAVSVAGA